MKPFIFVFSLLLISLASYGQVRPDQTAAIDSLTTTNFEFYSQRDGNLRKVEPLPLRRFVQPRIFMDYQTFSLADTTGFSKTYRGSFLKDQTGIVFFVDGIGNGIKVYDPGQFQALSINGNSLSLSNGNTVTIPSSGGGGPTTADQVTIDDSGLGLGGGNVQTAFEGLLGKPNILPEADEFANQSLSTFALSRAPIDPGNIRVRRNGVYEEFVGNYSLAGSTVTYVGGYPPHSSGTEHFEFLYW